MKHKTKQFNIEAKDFSGRKYYPGTKDHPFNLIDSLQVIVEKVPAPIYIILFFGITYLISTDPAKSILIFLTVLLDYFLLLFLPLIKLSYGPPTLTLILLGLMRTPFLFFTFLPSLAFQIMGTLLVIYGFYLEPHFPKVEQYHVSISNRKHTATLRIIHLSDLHMSYFSSREARVIQKVNDLKPDLICFTGDFFNLSHQDDPRTVQDIQDFFSHLKSRYGIFGVTGSPAVDVSESLARLPDELDMNMIDDQTRSIMVDSSDIRLIGLSCTQQPDIDSNRLTEILSMENNNQPDATILLYHAPDIAPKISDWPIDLQLSGHTHGGQVRLPLFGPLFTGSLYGLRFSSGLYQINQGIRLILSRGLGLEGNAAPRVRFLSPPEIGLITIEISQDTVEL